MAHFKGKFTFDQGPVGNLARGGNALGDAGARTGCGNTDASQRSLSHGIDLAIGADQRGHHQLAAQQAFGIAQRRHRHVDVRALTGKGGQGGGDHDGGNVLGVQGDGPGLIANVDAQAFQHTDQGFLKERRVLQFVAGLIQADHQSIPHQ